MTRKFAWAAIPLAVALAAATYVFLAGDTQNPATPREAESTPAAEGGISSGLPHAQPKQAGQKTSSATVAADGNSPERRSESKGDLTHFSLTHGDIGYVDVHSIMQDRDPYSIVNLLRTHHELTGADDSLEIRIDRIQDNEIWGREVLFTQLIDGRDVGEVGTVFFSSSGAVTRMHGDMITARPPNAGDILILPPEAEAVAREAAARYAATLEPEHPKWRDVPVTVTADAATMRYELDSNYALARLWRVPVSIGGPVATTIWVSVSPETGEVVGIKSAMSRSSDGITFIVCDAAVGMLNGKRWLRSSRRNGA